MTGTGSITRARRWAATTAALCALAAPGAAHARDATVQSFDGTSISLHFFPAAGLAAGERAPTVLVGPGFGQPGETDENSASSDATGNVGLGPLRDAGYNVLTWDPRGFGSSGGEVNIDSPGFEARDASALIDWVAQQPEAKLDGAGDPRLGMSGGSYGGGIQWITAARDARVDVIAPNISWNSQVSSLYKDAALKFGWGSALCGIGIAGSMPGALLNPDGVNLTRVDDHMLNLCVNGVATGKMASADMQWLLSHGPAHLLSQVDVPAIITQGTVDTLFTLKEAISNYEVLRNRGVPTRMLWFCGGHGGCLTGAGEAGHVERAVLKWFKRHLDGDTSVQTGPRFEWLADDAQWRSASDYPLPAGAPLGATGSGTLPIAHVPSGALVAATLAANAVNVTIPVGASGAQIVGEPTVKLTYSGIAQPAQTHVYAQLLDSTGRVVGNVATPIPVTLDGVPRAIFRRLEAIASQAAPGKSYTLQITPASTLYTEQRSAGAMTLSKVEATLPRTG